MHSNLVYPKASILFARGTDDAWWFSQHAAAYVVALDLVEQREGAGIDLSLHI